MNTKATGWTFAQVPIWLICSDEVSKSATVVFAYLKYRQGTDSACWPSLETISRDVGMHKATIRGKISELEEAGYIIKHTRAGQTNLYELIANPQGEVARWDTKVKKRKREKKKQNNPPEKQPPSKKSSTPPSKKSSTPPSKKSSTPPSKLSSHDDNQGQESRTKFAPTGARVSEKAPEATDETTGTEEETVSQEFDDAFPRDNPPEPTAHKTSREEGLAGAARASRAWTERHGVAKPERWWDDRVVHGVLGVAAKEIREVLTIVERATSGAMTGSDKPTGSVIGHLVGAAGCYKAAGGDMRTIERGIREAWRDPQWRPASLACGKDNVDRNGFVRAVKRAKQAGDSTTGASAARLTLEEAMS